LSRQAAHDWLMGRINFERTLFVPYQDRQLKLDRMRQLLTRLGQPDAGMKIVHVAGTKGKGSTSAMVASILTAAGFRSGVFSSPHLERIEERFSVDGQPCTAAEFVALVERLRPVVNSMDQEAANDGDSTGGPTYFEITTAMALLHFVERQVDVAVLEVGLGGRLDSTNVCLPAVCVITTISFDHMKQLGNTLAAIAREKAGIIKPGVPVICGVADAEPQAVIARVALDHGCRLIQLGRDFSYEYLSRASDSPRALAEFSTFNFSYTVPGQEQRLEKLALAMRGPHQAANAAVALATIAELRHQGWCVSEKAVRLGLSQSVLPGRVEVFDGPPKVVLDAAHNPAAAEALVSALEEMPPPSVRTLIIAASKDKDVRSIVAKLAAYFDRFVVTQYEDNPRAIQPDTLAKIIRDVAPNIMPASIWVCPTPGAAWQFVTQTAVPGELVTITGSFYLAAEMRPLVLADQSTGGRSSRRPGSAGTSPSDVRHPPRP
jgi:dihydrofolate synthase/folylpolyglutamate synthase